MGICESKKAKNEFPTGDKSIHNKLLETENNKNYIIAEICIKEEDVNKEIRIINSYGEFMRNTTEEFIKDDIFKNEDEIKKYVIELMID